MFKLFTRDHAHRTSANPKKDRREARFKVHLSIQDLIAMSSENLKVISVGANLELLWLRNAVLQNAGFEVLTSCNENEALNFIERGDCGVLLVCYSLSFAVRQRLAKAFRQHCPQKRIVAITNQPLEAPDFADGFVYGVEGPEVLIDTIRNDLGLGRSRGPRDGRPRRASRFTTAMKPRTRPEDHKFTSATPAIRIF